MWNKARLSSELETTGFDCLLEKSQPAKKKRDGRSLMMDRRAQREDPVQGYGDQNDYVPILQKLLGSILEALGLAWGD